MRVRVERTERLWPWAASVWDGDYFHLTVGLTQRGALRSLRREIRRHRKRRGVREMLELEQDV